MNPLIVIVFNSSCVCL